MLQISVGVMAYNEERTIAALLRAVSTQRLRSGSLKQILVVASGCTDRTVDHVRWAARKDPRIELLAQPNREGKASAVNLFLTRSCGTVNLLIGADLLPAEDAFEHLIRPFQDSRVGMTGGRPIPRNPLRGVVHYAVHLQWRLHHRMAMIYPKLGEMVAFRAVVPSISKDTWVDEVALEYYFITNGYRLIYVPDAVVWNRGPGTVSDFIKQRRRIHSGHIDFFRKTGYRVPTSKTLAVIRAFKSELETFPLPSWPLLGGAVLLEAWARMLGLTDATIKTRSHTVWEPSLSTKQPLNAPP